MMSDTFIASLEIMGIGMAGIFIFMLLFWLIITILHRAFPGTREEEETRVRETNE